MVSFDNASKARLQDQPIIEIERAGSKDSKLPIQGWFGGEGGTACDAWLTTAAAQIGQVALALPHAVSLCGLRVAIPLMLAYSLGSMWTIHLLTTLYLELKRRKIAAGTWAGGHEQRATQYYNVVGELTGSRIVKGFVCIITIISLVCTGIAQLVAMSTGSYYLNTSVDKRTWTLIWGAILTTTMIMVPNFRHFRLLSTVSLAGTAYTAIYITVTTAMTGLPKAKPALKAGPVSWTNVLLASNVFMSGFGGHSMSFEVIDALYNPGVYDTVYPYSYMYTWFVTLPHSILTQLAFPVDNAKYSNVYGVLPNNVARNVSIILMIIHQVVAYALYMTPVFLMWEKAVRTNNKSLWIRLPSRLPVALLVWFIALLFPFFDTINALQGAVGYSFTAFVFPSVAYLWVYRAPQYRATAPKKPMFVGGWAVAMTLNVFIAVFFLLFGSIVGTVAAVKNLINNIGLFSCFAPCFQCGAIVISNIQKG